MIMKLSCNLINGVILMQQKNSAFVVKFQTKGLYTACER